MDMERHWKKKVINLLPPPPKSLNKLPEEERNEVVDYLIESAEETYRLIKEDAEKDKEIWKEYCERLALSASIAIIALLVVIGILIAELNKY